ncbi:hypothetical protein Hanom_Chr15g01392791 [Helianthus anomalus]
MRCDYNHHLEVKEFLDQLFLLGTVTLDVLHPCDFVSGQPQIGLAHLQNKRCQV